VTIFEWQMIDGDTDGANFPGGCIIRVRNRSGDYSMIVLPMVQLQMVGKQAAMISTMAEMAMYGARMGEAMARALDRPEET
jgi:hypothetical protein